MVNNNQVGSRTIVIGETGWSDAGSNPAANPANRPSMRKWLRDFVCLAQEQGWQYYWFIAYDSDWRRVNENDPTGVEGHFGIFDQEGNIKPFFDGFSIDCTSPPVNINPNAVDFAPTPATTSSTTPPTRNPTKAPTYGPTDLPTRAPSKAPFAATNVPTRTPTTSMPTSSPIDNTDTQRPTTSPVATILAPTESPVEGTTLSPTSIPTENPTTSPSTPPPPFASVSAQCQDHSECANLSLAGNCCPTVDNWTLDCCNRLDNDDSSASNDGPPSDRCQAHPVCRDLGLADACCPTATGVYLDCCNVVPNDCHASGSCQVYSAVVYLAEQQSSAATGTLATYSWLTMFCLMAGGLAMV